MTEFNWDWHHKWSWSVNLNSPLVAVVLVVILVGLWLHFLRRCNAYRLARNNSRDRFLSTPTRKITSGAQLICEGVVVSFATLIVFWFLEL